MKQRFELKVYDGEYRIVSNIAKAEYYSNLPPITPIDIGLPLVNKYIKGVTPGELIVLGGHPKSGKSTLAKTLIRNFSEGGHPPLVFSYEEPMDQFLSTFDNWSRDITFFVPNMIRAYDMDWIEERMIEAKEKMGTQIVFIDHGQFLFQIDGKTNALIIGNVARRLKNITRDNGMIVFLIWHLAKPKEKSTVDNLSEHQLRDTQVLLNELDTLLFMYRGVKSDGIVQSEESYIKVMCTRRSGVIERIIPVVKNGNYFEESGVYL